MKAKFKESVRDLIAAGWSPRDSIRLAREQENPYRGAFWQSPQLPQPRNYVRYANGHTEMIPAWRGGNRNSH